MTARASSIALALGGLLAQGCGSSEDDGDSSGSYAQARIECVDRINQFRATEGKPPYQRWTGAEVCSDDEARKDAASGEPHGAFGQCGESAQNECPDYNSVTSVLGSCLDQMWAEGPGADFQQHGHYLNMSSTNYTKVACGFHESPKGVWAVQNFE
jgi:hypothetical protein